MNLDIMSKQQIEQANKNWIPFWNIDMGNVWKNCSMILRESNQNMDRFLNKLIHIYKVLR
jgi:hypothetical protein